MYSGYAWKLSYTCKRRQSIRHEGETSIGKKGADFKPEDPALLLSALNDMLEIHDGQLASSRV